MSKKYEHRIDHLKEHDKEEKTHHEEIKQYSKDSKISQLKKEDKKLRKKLDESEYTFL